MMIDPFAFEKLYQGPSLRRKIVFPQDVGQQQKRKILYTLAKCSEFMITIHGVTARVALDGSKRHQPKKQ